MRPEEFVRAMSADVVGENLSLYSQMLRSTDRTQVEDGYWTALLSLYDSLDDEGRTTILAIMRQVSVDAVSNVLGILDGSTSSSIGDEELALLDGHGNRLDGVLQELFLSTVDAADTD